MRPFQDETKLNETPSLSLHNLALGDYPQPSPAEANQHHADLLEDLAEKSKIIEKLESEIDTLRTELEETRDQLDRALQGAPPSGKSSNGVSPREPKKSVHSLLEDLSERENQIYEKVWVKKITAFISRTQLIKNQSYFHITSFEKKNSLTHQSKSLKVSKWCKVIRNIDTLNRTLLFKILKINL